MPSFSFPGQSSNQSLPCSGNALSWAKLKSADSGSPIGARECPLLDQSRQRSILACNGLSTNDPSATNQRELLHCQ